MANRYLAFDLEIAAIVPDGETDWKAYRPLGITCAAIAWQTSNGVVIDETWHGESYELSYTPRMTPDECGNIVRALMAATSDGFTLLTHNGVSFDLDILAEESGLHAECVELAMNSVDTILEVFCRRGHPVGLDAIAKGFGLQGKMEGVNGALAPQLWANGDYDTVLQYVSQDAKATLEVALAIEKHGAIKWIAKSGRMNMLSVRRLMTAREALALPEPNTSWMSDPMPRSRFTEWMQKQPS